MTALAGLFNIIPGWVWALITAGAMATSCVQTTRVSMVKTELFTLKAQHAEAARAAEASARSKEQAAAATLAQTEKEARDAQKRLSADLAAALDSLRKRPKRPASGDVPKSPADPVGCTGAQLYRPDASFLIGESARADRLRIALAACQAAYDSAVTLTK